VPGGFVLIDAPVEVQQVNKDIDKQKEHARRVKKLAQEAPPFDPAEAPSMRSTLTDLLVKRGGEHWVAAAEQRLKGGGGGDEQSKFLDRVLQGQLPPALTAKKGATAVNAVNEKSEVLWNPIPIDAPTAPFKLSLTTGIPFEINPRGAAFDTIVMKGPYYVSFPWWLVNRQGNLKFDLFRDPKNKNRYIEKIQQHYPPHKVIDLRDGKTVGEFDWRAPVWANARLSPDGKFLVGNDSLAVLQYIMSSTATAWDNGKDTVFIWAQGKKTPTSFKVPGVVDWMDFVGNDRLAYVTYAPKTVMRIHDVAKNAQVAEIELPGAAPAQHPDRQNDDTPVFPTLEFYRPMARRGAVSANGKYVALGCQDGVRLISISEGKVIGLLPIDGAKWYRSLNFSADGARLFGVIIAVKKTYGDVSLFRSWSVATGQSLEDLMVDRHETGPVYPGPVDGLYLATKFIFTRQPLPLDPAPFRILRLDDDGTALVAGSHQQAPPGTPQTESLIEKMKGKQWRPDEIEVHRKNEWALFTVKLDWSPAVKKIEPVLAVLRPRPAAKAADRAGVVAQKPKPPEVWSPPSFVPAPEPAEENDDVHAMHQFGAWPISFGDEKAAIVRYVPKTHYRKRWQVWLDLVDRNTGKRGAPAAKLWDWAHFPDQVGTLTDEPANPGNMGTPRPLPPIGALRPDAELFALVDPSDARRVDVFKTNGERLFGFIPVNDARIDWLGWSRTNLLTVAAGRLKAWEPTSGKAVFEVDGDYTRVGEVSPDRKWVALWTGKYADILDIETGKCLGRCQAGGFSGRLLTFNLSPDAKHLVASFSGWPKGLPANGPGNTAVVWNLETGKAGLHGFAGDRDQRGQSPAQATCAWVGNEHLLLCGGQLTDPATLIDLRLEMAVGTFRMSGGGYVAGQPAVTGPDGRIWYATSAILGAPKGFNPHVPDHPDFPAGFVWHTVSLPGFHGKDAFLADAKREFVELLSQPVQVQAKLGTKRESEALARAAARTLQANGLRIGPGGTVLRVQGALEDTEETISFIFGATVKIPRCNMLFQWLSEKDAELWKHKSTSTWSMSSSRYKVSEKQESFGVGGVRRYEFDFKGQNPSAAMREELLESLTKGGPGTLQLPNLQFLRVNGEDHPVPVSGTMVVRLPPSAPGKKLR
jgi:hypothetical protein